MDQLFKSQNTPRTRVDLCIVLLNTMGSGAFILIPLDPHPMKGGAFYNKNKILLDGLIISGVQSIIDVGSNILQPGNVSF